MRLLFSPFLPPQTKFAKVMFLHLSVSHSVYRRGLLPGVCSWEVSRPTPGGGVCSCGGSPGPHLGGVSRLTPGGAPGPHLGVSRPTPGGFLGPHPGGVIPACTEADPPSRRQLLRAVRIPLECILVSENSLDKTFTAVFAVELCVHLLVARVLLYVGICTGF